MSDELPFELGPLVGDRVTLTSGSWPMEIEAIDGENITVKWKSGDGKEHTQTFPSACLEPARDWIYTARGWHLFA